MPQDYLHIFCHPAQYLISTLIHNARDHCQNRLHLPIPNALAQQPKAQTLKYLLLDPIEIPIGKAMIGIFVHLIDSHASPAAIRIADHLGRQEEGGQKDQLRRLAVGA